MQDSNTHTVKQYTYGNKGTHKIITQYTKDQLHLAAMHIGKATQWGENTVPSKKYCIYLSSSLYNTVPQNGRHLVYITF